MSFLRIISIKLRNFLVKRHSYFTCCASCGDIATPLKHRLCTSLAPDFAADAIIVPHERSTPYTINATKQRLSVRMPWLQTIYIHAEGSALQSADTAAGQESGQPELILPASKTPLPLYARAYEAAGLREHFLVIEDGAFIPDDTILLDYFTPNGLPLLLLQADGKAVTPGTPLAGYRIPQCLYPHTKENSRAYFLTLLDDATDNEKGFESFCLWAFTEGRVVPSNLAWNL